MNYLNFETAGYLYRKSGAGIHPNGLALSSENEAYSTDTTHPVPLYGIAIPTRDDSAVNKKYVDDKYNALEARIAELEKVISQITIKEE